MQYSLACTEDGQTLGINSKMANRHGLIAGATGTGKTVNAKWQKHLATMVSPSF